MHWASDYIGHPWTPETNCWWLVRDAVKKRLGIDMPEAPTDAIKSGWQKVDEPRDGDILLCRDAFKRRHVGMVIESNGLRLLHNDGHMTERGPVGSVQAPKLRDVEVSDVEFWRPA
jgi:cell wall-associated NlpC family hydrolase